VRWERNQSKTSLVIHLKEEKNFISYSLKKTFIGGGASNTEKPVTAPWTNLQLLVEMNFFLKTTIDVAFAYL
jgi:hypothetical protein